MSTSSINIEPNPGSSKSSKITNRIFVFFVILGLIVIAGCLSQNKKEAGSVAPASDNGQTSADSGEGYAGKIIKTPEGSQYDDYLKTADAEYGLDALAQPLKNKIIELRDSGKEVIVSGDILTDVPDYSGRQISVVRIEIPSDKFALEWFQKTVENLGISFQQPKYTKVDVTDNALNFDGWALEFYKNPKNLEFQAWLNANYAESGDKPCQIKESPGIMIGNYPTYEVFVGAAETCEKIGYFAMSGDKQNIVKLLLTDHPNQNYQEIISTLRFIKNLSQDQVDLNATKNNTSNGQAGLANPASVYCEEQGGKLEIRADEKTKSQYGVCIFSGGKECEEWAFYRGECQK